MGKLLVYFTFYTGFLGLAAIAWAFFPTRHDDTVPTHDWDIMPAMEVPGSQTPIAHESPQLHCCTHPTGACRQCCDIKDIPVCEWKQIPDPNPPPDAKPPFIKIVANCYCRPGNR